MSGLVALLDRDGGAVDPGVFRAALEAIDHRGPDGRGAWRDEPVALGHQQLQSTPESRVDDQPYREGDLVVTADARLDNRDELFRALELSVDEPVPDSHLLLESYRKWGERCVDHLVGAFAFAVWDDTEKTLFCARDHMGVKPLYYHQSDSQFSVASEMRSLLRHPSVSHGLNDVRVGDFFVGRFGEKSNTIYNDLARLPPAHAVSVTTDTVEMWQYWDLDPTRTVVLDSDAKYERRFRELFQQAVECRLRTAGSVGTTLSGGMDSSSVTVVARDILPDSEPLHTFSLVFNDAPSSDEREYIKTLTERSGIAAQYIALDDIGVLVDRDVVFDDIDEPPFNTMHYGLWELAKRAADTDTCIILDGAFGDAATGYGISLLQQLLRTGQWLRLWSELNQLSDGMTASVPGLFVNHAAKPLIPDPLLRMYRSLRGAPVLERQMNPTLSNDFIERIGLRSRYKRLYEDRALFGRHPRRMQYDSIMSANLTMVLEATDKKFARHGIEMRHPFTDKRLLEFSLAIPTAQQLAGGWTRSIIRRALSDLLPDKIRYRVWKTTVTEGFYNALAHDDDALQACLAAPGDLTKYVDIDELRRAHYRFQREESPDPREARALWRALSFRTWLDQGAATE